MLLGFNICAKHVLVWCFLSFIPAFPTSSTFSSFSYSSCPPQPTAGASRSWQCPARAGSLWWPGHLGAPGITFLQEQGVAGRAFDLRSEVGKEASFQIPCQLVWLISSRAHSNKNQHLHNIWGHLGSSLLSGKDYVPASDAPVPGRGASDCQPQ